MKIIAATTIFLMLQRDAGVSAEGMAKAMKPPHGRRGIVLAGGGHNVVQHARRTAALAHSKARHRSAKAAAGSRHLQDQFENSPAFSPASSPASYPAPAFAPAFSPAAYDSGPFPCPLKDVLDDMGLTVEEAGCDLNATVAKVSPDDPDDSWLLEDDCAGPPPCPPKEILALLNLTLEELQCDSVVTPPCPYPEIATELGLDVNLMNCSKDFYCFSSHQAINTNTSIPCASDSLLFELELIYGVWCESADESWLFGASDIAEQDFNYTTLECPAPVPCSLPFFGEGAMGITVCTGTSGLLLEGGEEAFPGVTMCIAPSEAFEGDTCGCCGGQCPQPCTGTTCKLPVAVYNDYYDEEQGSGNNSTAAPSTETGVWLVDVDGGYAQCVTSEQSAFMQMDGYFTCMDACSP